MLCEGAIELSILADYYGREIAAYDIQTTRCDLYGQVSHFDAILYAFKFCHPHVTELIHPLFAEHF